MNALQRRLDRLHEAARRRPWLHAFAAVDRLLLAAGFIPTGLVKLLGHRFTQLGPETPVGYFFDAFYAAGGWYRFVGAVQLAAGILLLIPPTSTLGAILYFPIIVNIFVITIAVGFTGTWAVAGLMVLANLYLLCWDYHRLRPILFQGAVAPPPDPERARSLTTRVAWAGMALGVVGAAAWTRGYAPGGSALPWIGLGALSGVLWLGAALNRSGRGDPRATPPAAGDGAPTGTTP